MKDETETKQCSHFLLELSLFLFFPISFQFRSDMKKAKEVIFDNYTRNPSLPNKKASRKAVRIVTAIDSSWKQKEKASLYMHIGKTLSNQ